MKRHSILVTNGEQRSSLAVVRSLGRHGHRVVVSAHRRHSLAGVSRFASSESVVPSPTRDPEGFVNAIVELSTREQIDAIIPTTDDALLALLPARERLQPAVLPVGSEQAYRSASDKAFLQSIAPRFGIAVPRQVLLDARRAIGADEIRFPVVVKPSVSVNANFTRNFAVRHAATNRELETILAEAPAESYPLLVQEKIVGPGIGVFLLSWGGEQVAAFSHRRLREKPPGGGVSVYAESIALDEELVARSRQLLSDIGFEGVAMVEYKLDCVTGVPYLLEVNGRFWGSLQLAIDAGVDFPQLLISVAVDGVVPPRPNPIPGVRTRWWWGDVDHLIARFRRSPAELGLTTDAPTRGRALRDFLRSGGPLDRNQILRMDDLRPAWRETLDWIARR